MCWPIECAAAPCANRGGFELSVKGARQCRKCPATRSPRGSGGVTIRPPGDSRMSPYNIASALPQQQARSHWAWVGSENRRPVRAESHRQNSIAFVQGTRATGCCGRFTGKPLGFGIMGCCIPQLHGEGPLTTRLSLTIVVLVVRTVRGNLPECFRGP